MGNRPGRKCGTRITISFREKGGKTGWAIGGKQGDCHPKMQSMTFAARPCRFMFMQEGNKNTWGKNVCEHDTDCSFAFSRQRNAIVPFRCGRQTPLLRNKKLSLSLIISMFSFVHYYDYPQPHPFRQGRHNTSTASVRNRCVHAVSANVNLAPY